MIFKKFAFVMLLGLLLCPVQVRSAESAEALNYGDIISINTFEGYMFAYDFGIGGGIVQDTAHSGQKSYMTDFSVANANLNLHTNTVTVYDKYAYYAEAYLKTEEIEINDITNIWLEAPSGDKQGTRLTIRETDENGWSRYSAYRKTPAGQAGIRVFMYLTPSSGKLYVDDVIIRVAPYSLRVVGTTADANTTVNLNALACYGADKNGNEKRIYLNNMKRWSVKSGNAVVDQNGNLKWNDSAGGTAQVQLEFCGVTTTFDVVFTAGISVTEPERSGDTYTLTVKNPLAAAETIKYTIVLYDDEGRLYKLKSESTTVQGGGEKEIYLQAMEEPYFIKNGVQKIMVSAPHFVKSYLCE